MSALVSSRLPWPVSLIDAIRQWLSRVPLSLLQLLMRIAIGSVFFNTGLLKYRSWEITLLSGPRSSSCC